MVHPLDDVVRSALTGPHAHLAQRCGRILRYPPDVLRFIAIPDPATAGDWADVATLVGPEQAPVAGVVVLPPVGWKVTGVGPGLQLVTDRDHPRRPNTAHGARAGDDVLTLGPADLPEIVEFVARHRNGRAFLPRTLELGVYLGIRRGGVLVAMAGERLRPVGWTEVSAVCTDPGHRRQGLAARLLDVLVSGIHERGENAFLHVAADNVAALGLYEQFGFRLRRPITMAAVHIPGDRDLG
ncbi:GNAT family N-acetyltransferase [Hamadaea sp. NPDC051192]|uniref:GNAT family N-acetyltransferase n=1 Tax=Hamadaea sp. NPDC051192 TaxID=3154940 RepID=UPI0034132696